MVPGEGPQPCLAMIVGEAPGKEEVAQGRPFVGKSGKALETALKAMGLARDDCYITNVVKELPLDASGRIRRPYAEEIIAWEPVLVGEIENTAPRSILALGRTASQQLVGWPEAEIQIPFGSKIGNVYTAWHPAYLLRKGMGPWSEWLDQIHPWAESLR